MSRLIYLLFAAAMCSGAVSGKTKAGGFTYLGSSTEPSTKRNSILGNSQTDYHLSDGKATWEDALRICSDELGGRLLSLESAAKEATIKSYLSGYTLDYIWTSGRFDEQDLVWYWPDSGHVLEYTNWKAGVTPSTGQSFRIAYYKAIKPNWQSLPKSNLNRFICELTPIAEPCFSQKDLVVVLDGSGSIAPQDFLEAQDFVSRLARAFTVYDPTKIGFVVYSNVAKIEIPLHNSLTPNAIEAAITAAHQPQGSTNTSGGIDTAILELGVAPSGIPRVVVLLTDGQSTYPTQTFTSAAAANAAGITGFAVGIGSYSTAELYAIANNDPNRIFTTDTFDNLIHLLAPLGHRICQTFQ